MKDLAICLILIGLFIATMLLVGQRDYGLESRDERIAALEDTLQDRNIPRIEISGRANVYAGEHEVIVERVEK